MGLENWDRTAAYLDALELRARTMKRLAGEIQKLLTDMKARPAFETEAQDCLSKLAEDIAILHAFTKASLEHYLKLPETA